MALVAFARRLHQITHPHLFLPYSLKSLNAQHLSSTSFYSNSTQPFHQTLLIHTQYNIHSLQFSTLQPYLNHKIYETINFSQLTDETNEHNQLGVSKLHKFFLDKSGMKPNENMIISAIWALRADWKLAFFVFKWGQKWSCNFEKVWSLMIWLLGNHKKFNTAWCLVRNLHRSSMDIQRAMLIMIDRFHAIPHLLTMEKWNTLERRLRNVSIMVLRCFVGRAVSLGEEALNGSEGEKKEKLKHAKGMELVEQLSYGVVMKMLTGDGGLDELCIYVYMQIYSQKEKDDAKERGGRRKGDFFTPLNIGLVLDSLWE